MDKLHYSPGSCSLIVDTPLEEPGVGYEMHRVHTEAGEHRKPEYLAIKRMKNLEPFFRRMTERPAMARALEREGIVAFGATT